MVAAVPARVAGSYKTPAGYLTLKQEYQMLSGTLIANNRTVPLEGRVRGDEVSFRAGGKNYRGRYGGGHLELR